MKRIVYQILYGALHGISLLPLPLLYGVADAATFLLHGVVRYRRKVVRKNLTSSFPEKDIKEIKKIERAYYRFLGDYIVETIKLLSISEKEMMRRMTFIGLEKPLADMRRGRDVTLYLGHYCNWEWITSIPLHAEHNDKYLFGEIYMPLHNKPLDKVFQRLRTRFGSVCIKKSETLREIVRKKREEKTTIIGYIADQVPTYDSIHLWIPFLNHETGVFTGAEKITKAINAVPYYVDMEKTKRGYYKATIKKIEAPIDQFGAVTAEYFRMLEETIRRAPAYWLWSHRRWKRTRIHS